MLHPRPPSVALKEGIGPTSWVGVVPFARARRGWYLISLTRVTRLSRLRNTDRKGQLQSWLLLPTCEMPFPWPASPAHLLRGHAKSARWATLVRLGDRRMALSSWGAAGRYTTSSRTGFHLLSSTANDACETTVQRDDPALQWALVQTCSVTPRVGHVSLCNPDGSPQKRVDGGRLPRQVYLGASGSDLSSATYSQQLGLRTISLITAAAGRTHNVLNSITFCTWCYEHLCDNEQTCPARAEHQRIRKSKPNGCTANTSPCRPASLIEEGRCHAYPLVAEGEIIIRQPKKSAGVGDIYV